MNRPQQDELAALFAQHMTFDSKQHADSSMTSYDTDIKTVEAQPTPFVSTHYIHPTHPAPASYTSSEPSRSPPPTYKESLVPVAMAQILLQHSIDPASLLPNQIQLFANAEYEQRLRLLELWRIAPPSYHPLEEQVNAWTPTSMKQEENLAKVRYETAIIARGVEAYQSSRSEDVPDSSNTYYEEPMSPIREAGEDPWPPAARMRAASIAASNPNTRPTSLAGPPVLADHRLSLQAHLDPVYNSTPSLGRSSNQSYPTQQLDVAHHYGATMDIRNYADWAASNQDAQHTSASGATAAHDDDDMVM